MLDQQQLWTLMILLWFTAFVAGVFCGIWMAWERKPKLSVDDIIEKWNAIYGPTGLRSKLSEFGNFMPLKAEKEFDPMKQPKMPMSESAGEKPEEVYTAMRRSEETLSPPPSEHDLSKKE
jgi:hypothetical protein